MAYVALHTRRAIKATKAATATGAAAATAIVAAKTIGPLPSPWLWRNLMDDNIIINASKVQSALGGANLLNDDLGAWEVPSRIRAHTHRDGDACKWVFV